MEKEKRNKVIGFASIALVAVIAIFGIIYFINSAKPQEGQKTITVTVVHKDKSEKDFTIKTTEENLEAALLQDKIVSGDTGDYGLFITEADGEKVNNNNQEWWCITKGGGRVDTAASMTMIADGDKYEITFTEGYDDF